MLYQKQTTMETEQQKLYSQLDKLTKERDLELSKLTDAWRRIAPLNTKQKEKNIINLNKQIEAIKDELLEMFC